MKREFRIIRPDGEVWAEGSASLAAEYVRQMEPGDILEYRIVTPWRAPMRSEDVAEHFRCAAIGSDPVDLVRRIRDGDQT